MATAGSSARRWAKVLMASGGGLAVLAPLLGFVLARMLAAPPAGGSGAIGSQRMETYVEGMRNGILVFEGSIALGALGVLILLIGLLVLLLGKLAAESPRS